MITKKILAGKYRGKTIILPPLSVTRSTKSITKESLFNTLQFDLIGENFVEVFGGSGSIGLEALSRGAKHAYFFEIDKKAFSILSKNCDNISKNDTTCIVGDSFQKLPKLVETLNKKTFFYFDPPFSIRAGMQEIYAKTINLISMIPQELSHLIIVEHASNQEMPETINKFRVKKNKKFGKTTLTYYM